MGSFWILIKKFGIIFSIIFFGCSSNKPVAQLEAYDDLDIIRKNLKEQRIEIENLHGIINKPGKVRFDIEKKEAIKKLTSTFILTKFKSSIMLKI